MVVYSPMKEKEKEKELDQTELRQAFGCFATGVVVITARDFDGNPIGMTVNSFSSLSLNPALLLWSIQKSSAQFDAFVEANYFNVHILRDNQEELSTQFARKDVDRFSGVEWVRDKNEVPLLEGCHAVFRCQAYRQYHDAGDHTIVVGEVLEVTLEEVAPLVFYRGGYCQLS